MRLSNILLIVGSAASVFALKEPPKTLQIGVKKRIPDAECTRRSSAGDTLSMHYTGTLFDTGAKFDSSLDRNQPLEFELGAGRVIKGWDLGLTNMCIGEQRKLVIPPDMGYGDRGAGNVIPGGATLVFEVELVDIKKGASKPKVVSTDEPNISFTSPSFILSTILIVGLFIVVYMISKKEEVASKPGASSPDTAAVGDGEKKD
ncbi:FK506-binding protein 2B [Backusella circina FSU 941]|nr:FK506-binding protein 2B [Backusella circina FSU 941]